MKRAFNSRPSEGFQKSGISLQTQAGRSGWSALLSVICLSALLCGCGDDGEAEFDDLRERGVRVTLDEQGHLLGVYLYSDEEHPFDDDDLKALATEPDSESPARQPKLLLIESRHVTDAGLAHVEKLKSLEELDLTYCRGTAAIEPDSQSPALWGGITDAGLERLKRMTWLKRLGLRSTRVSDKAVDELSEALPDCEIDYNYADPILAAISRRDGDVVGALAALGADAGRDDEDNVIDLKLGTTDLALKYIGRLETLTALTLRGNFTGTGLALLGGLSRLESLDIADPARRRTISAGDIRLLARFPRLRSLDLSGNKLSDDELKPLQEMSDLTTVKLIDCPVTSAGLKSLKQALPDCEITWSIDPLLNAALNHGDDVAAAVEATAESIDRNQKGDIVAVAFRHSRISDDGLLELKRLPAVERLSFTYCRRLSDDGTGHLKQFAHLKALTLSYTNLTNRGMIAIGDLAGLTSLDLTFTTAVDDAGVRELAGLVELTNLSLRGSDVTDTGLRRLTGMSKLASLDVRDTQVTKAGVDRLQRQLPNCDVQW